MQTEIPTYAELVRSEPRLAELEADLGDIEDDGSGAFFCSNFVWLPLTSRLQSLVGVHRREPGDPALSTSAAYRAAYLHLSPLIPPCRDCGCRRFAPVREAQAGDLPTPPS